MARLRIAGLWLAFMLLAQNAVAQVATLVADQVHINADTTITATGNVEILYETSRLKASSLTYNSTTDTLVIEGPLTLIDGENAVILADQAELDGRFSNGIMRGASMVLDQQLQLAAQEIHRVEGRYTQLDKTVASSCQICAGETVPLWQIRAKRVVHDQVEKQLYFYNAQFQVAGVPVVYLPRLRLPDPTVKRYQGLLVPDGVTSSRLGLGLRLPYFIPLGNSADITLTPYIAEKTRTLEFRYRQEFRKGGIEIEGAYSNDELLANTPRYYVFGKGRFNLPRNFRLNFDVEYTSDTDYLEEYDYSGKERLDSAVSITRTRRDEFLGGGLFAFQTLKADEIPFDDQLPNIQGDLIYERRFYPTAIGGQGSWTIALQGHNRESDADQVGRDVVRISGDADWSRGWTFDSGVTARMGGKLSADIYQISQDSTYEPYTAQFTPTVETELRWPLSRSSANGLREIIEPVMHLAWTGTNAANVPNDDSTLIAFDEGNLYSLNRFPGRDRYERGARASVGLGYTRFDPSGWSLGLSAGRVLRADDLRQFPTSSGLDGTLSDWLVAGHIEPGKRFSIDGRALLRDDASITSAEARLKFSNEDLTLASTYVWNVEDDVFTILEKTSELTLDATYEIGRHWKTNLTYDYDFDVDRATRAEFGVSYRTECIIVDLSVSRRNSTSSNVGATTGFGFSVSLNGFGSDGREFRRSCSG